MALANQESGAIEWGNGVFTGLESATPLTLVPPQAPGMDNRQQPPVPFPTVPFLSTSGGRGTQSILVYVVANAAFNVNYQFTPDGGTTWATPVQNASSTVTVDGGTAGYTNAATLTVQLGFQWRVQIYSTNGSPFNGLYEWRLYSENN